MKEIIIIPHIGIGQLKLGMAPDELEKTLLQMKRQWSNSSNEAMQMERCAETDDPNLIPDDIWIMIRSFWCSIGTEKLLKSASRESCLKWHQ